MPRRTKKAAAPPRIVEHIEVREIAGLTVNPRNPRRHSEEQIAQIVESIKRFGFTVPVLIDGDGQIIAGHGRVLGAKLLGMASVPTIDGSYLSAAERRAYLIADNKIALNSEWDEELLADELSSLADADFDMEVLGFAPEEMSKILGEAPPPENGRRLEHNIVFDSAEQQQEWFTFLRGLRVKYPNIETNAARLTAHIRGLVDGPV